MEGAGGDEEDEEEEEQVAVAVAEEEVEKGEEKVAVGLEKEVEKEKLEKEEEESVAMMTIYGEWEGKKGVLTEEGKKGRAGKRGQLEHFSSSSSYHYPIPLLPFIIRVPLPRAPHAEYTYL